MDEAIKLADKICIMTNGQVVQYDTPDNILRSQRMISLKTLLVRIA